MKSLPISARVAIFNQTGRPEVLQIQRIEVPAPASNEVRIQVKAIGLQRADAMFRKGQYIETPLLPAKIGYEAAGIVESIGPDVTNVKPGDIVSAIPVFSLNQYGTHGEYALIPAFAAEKHPITLSFEEAAALWSNYLTAYGLLIDTAQLTAGQLVIINAASSGVGLAAIQIANIAGAIPIALTTTSSKTEALLQAGAHHVIATAEQDVVAEIQRITKGKNIDVVIDAVGGPLLSLLISSMAYSGRIIIYGSLSPEPTKIPSMEILSKKISITGFTVYGVVSDPVRLQAAKDFIYKGLDRKQLKPVIAKVFPFTEMVEAHRFLESNKQVGKIVAVM